jgi:hypothetical protein
VFGLTRVAIDMAFILRCWQRLSWWLVLRFPVRRVTDVTVRWTLPALPVGGGWPGGLAAECRSSVDS